MLSVKFGFSNGFGRNKDILDNFTKISNFERVQLIVKNSFNAITEPTKLIFKKDLKFIFFLI